MDPISATEKALDQTRSFLTGYGLLEWPDLSSCRRPDDAQICNEVPLFACGDHFVILCRIVLAIARIVAAYCGRNDILLGVQSQNDNALAFIRVAWAEQDNQLDVLAKLSKDLEDASSSLVNATAIRQVLDINTQSPPCPAILFTSRSFFEEHSEYPLSFLYESSESKLIFRTSSRHAHPSVASQILAQVASLGQQPHSSNMASFGLAPELLSVCERSTDDTELGRAYAHAPVVRHVTDYLSLCAQSKPDAIALRYFKHISPDMQMNDGESLTYQSLDQKANKFARWLRKMGLQNEDKVAVCMERNVLFHIALMGILRAGGCYVPIDPELPVERKTFIAKDSEARFVLVCGADFKTIFGSRSVDIDTENTLAAIEAESNDPVNIAEPDGLAYLLYTSGTTGTPKGCLLTNRGLAEAILALSTIPYHAEVDNPANGNYLAIASIAFDVHLSETFAPFIVGIPLICAPRNELLEDLPSYITAFRISHLGIVPSLIEATMTAVQDSNKENVCLRFIGSGGEKMSDAILDRWADHPFIRLANFYGPSEVTIGCCARIMDPLTPRANIGRVFANVSGYIVDSDLNILPRGGTGELVVEGPLVGRGYHNRPELTKKAFLAWPSKNHWSYRTGDLVRMMPDGTLEILGRIDTQIKLRGVRIESEGISSIVRSALPSTPEFALDATTILAKHPSINVEQLVTFVSWNPAVAITTRKSQAPHLIPPLPGLLSTIRKKCDAELARYMRPSHIVPLSWLPLSSNGKSDAKVLARFFERIDIQQLGSLMADGTQAKDRALSPQEGKVFNVLKRHAQLPTGVTFGPDLNLFECGLDSLGIIRFTADLSNAFQCKITASDVMQSPTLAAVSSFLDHPSEAPKEQALVSVESFRTKWQQEIHAIHPELRVVDVLPAFGLQEGVLSQSANDSTLYVQHVIFSGAKDLLSNHLRSAWEEAVKRHQILRTLFHFDADLIQVVLSPDINQLPWEEKSTLIHDDEEFSRWFYESMALGINQEINESLSDKVPFRLFIYRSAERVFLVLSIHHALYDAISLRALIEDVESVLAGEALPPPSSLPAVLERIANTDVAKAEAFWKQHFQSFIWPPMRTIAPAPPSSGTSYYTSRFATSLSILKRLATSQKVTLQALLTYAFAKLLASKVYSSTDISFGVIRSGRLLPIDGIENAICPLVTVTPLRVDLKGNTVLQDIQKNISTIVEMEHIPLGKVQKWVRPDGPIFDLLFSVSTTEKNRTSTWESIRSQPPEADYKFSCEVVLDFDQDQATVHAVSKKAEFPDEMAKEIVEHFDAVSTGLVNLSYERTSGDRAKSSSHPPPRPSIVEEPPLPSHISHTLKENLRRILSGFLGVNLEIIGDSTSLPSLGVDSIKSVGLARTLKKDGYNIRPIDILKASSLHSLAALLSSQSTQSEVEQDTSACVAFRRTVESIRSSLPTEFDDSVKLDAADEVTVYPTTSLQAGMLSQTIKSEGVLYLHAFIVTLKPHIDFTRLHEAWTAVISALDILKTSFHFDHETGVWIQVVHSHPTIGWTESTFGAQEDLDQTLQHDIALARCQHEADFYTPPIRLHLYHSDAPSQNHSRLALIIHHALYDGISIGKLFNLVRTTYEATDRKVHPQQQFTNILPEIIYQETAGLPYWMNILQGHQKTHLPVQFESESERFLSAEKLIAVSHDRLTQFLRHTGINSQCLGQAAWAKLLASVYGSKDVVFGQVVSGRSLIDAENMIGPVLNTIPCRVTFGNIANIRLLESIHRANVNASTWQHVSLRALHKSLRTLALWDTLFVFQPLVSDDEKQERLWKFDERQSQDLSLQYALNLEMNQTQKGFLVRMAGSARLINQQHLETLVNLFEEYLQELLEFPEVDATASIQDLRTLLGFQPSEPTGSGCDIQTPIAPSDIPILDVLASITKIPVTDLTNSTLLVALGIDSITAIQLVSRFKTAGMWITSNDVISSRTIGDLISKVKPAEQRQAQGKHYTLPEVTEKTQSGVLQRLNWPQPACQAVIPSTPGVKWLVAAWQNSGKTAYQHAFAYRLPSSLSTVVVRAAWQRLVETIPILRATVGGEVGSEEPYIVVSSNPLPEDSWAEATCDADAVQETIISTMRQLVAKPPPLTTPPTKAILLRTPENLHFILYLHHLQYDAWSLSILIDDLRRLCINEQPKGDNSLESFFSVAGRHSENLSGQEVYWKSIFSSSFEPIFFPSLHKAPSPSFKRVLYTDSHAIRGATALEKAVKARGLSLNSVFLASWAKIQGTRTASPAATFMLWQAGRTEDAVFVTAPCSNVVPIRVGGLDDASLLKVSENIQVDLQHRTAAIIQSDLEDIHRWTGIKGPLCNVLINIVKLPEAHTPGETEGEWEQVNVPFYLPEAVPEEDRASIDRIATANFVQNDLVVDFAVIPGEDTVLVSINASEHILNEAEAKDLVKEWSESVQSIMSAVM